MKHLTIGQAIVGADEKKRLGCGDHYRFHLDDDGELLYAEAWDDGFECYGDITGWVRLEEKYLADLREYYFTAKAEAMDRDPMDLARESAVDEWDGKEGA